ncbi:helix-turn-helix domain-containing protein [Gluconacetobacter diazotrophicus]|uniref:Putative transcriptional Regulator n=1 Tax=Gluconacetobacter diazotrophicus (strain ATCC 49037 / DSM 5601 / CCUG 37298 / CIP 103539 / LMG 7603 / PAl5) TaxID=272568 RepID=A9HFD0_GLUDA|nr:helix-turn-helix domain-containing protein [Gluconacetobacter diazotrophicus]CAP55344.1 putative transcriptional Regulator [Gluconacetobacter diazotrophicus PA1 5]
MVNYSLMQHSSDNRDFKGRKDGLTDKPVSGPSPVDVHVGGRIRLRRTLMGLSQERLGDALGLTFQQVQKYERGTNRVSASRLYELSEVLDVPVSFFFDGLDSGQAGSKATNAIPGFAQAQEAFGGAPEGAAPASEIALFSRREMIELVRIYYRIEDPAMRRRVLDLIRMMAPPE